MSTLSLKPKSYPTTIYLIAANRQAAEGLGRHYGLRRRWLGHTAMGRAAAIERWRAMPDSMRQRYHVHRVNVLVTDDCILVTGVIRLALLVAVGIVAGGIVH
jgi:hypothetical protein